jgi:membrane-associated phospholipid phosphatase
MMIIDQENLIYSRGQMLVADVISLSSLIPVVGSLVLYVVGYGSYYGWLFTAIIVANVAAASIKELSGNGHSLLKRPLGATACDAFCIGPIVEGKPGFPSGHTTTIAMFVAALWLQDRDPRILYIGVPWIFAMGWARIAKRCHTWFQVAGGLMLGIFAAYGLHLILRSQ